jgi:hypothetical protein
MAETARALAALAAGFMALLAVASAAEAAQRTWVASNGFGTTCSRTAPCATFQTAHNATDFGGEINCVDAGEYGGLVITKAITIDCSGFAVGVQTGVINGIVINAPGAVVTLRGLTIDASGAGTVGVLFHKGRALHVDKCWISGFNTEVAGADLPAGIRFSPPAGVAALLDVSDTIVSDSGAWGSGGIVVEPSGSGSARVTLTRVQLVNNRDGLFVNGGGSTGLIIVQLRDSVVAGANTGIFAFTTATASPTAVTVDRTASVLNSLGIGAQGPVFVIVGGSTVTANSIGLGSIADGNIFSYGNNQLDGNISDGVPTVTIVEK